jgi:TPR repeat protein
LSKEHDRIEELYTSDREEEAIRAWTRLASDGDVQAMMTLGEVLLDDLGNYPESIKWFQKAKDAGALKACCFLADAYTCLADYVNAENELKEAIQNGFDEAVLDLANLYAKELNDPRSAASFLAPFAQSGQIEARNLLIVLYTRLEKPEEIEKLLLEDVENGVQGSVERLANLYENELDAPQKAEALHIEQAQSGRNESKIALIETYLNRELLTRVIPWVEDLKHSYLSEADVSGIVKLLRSKYLKRNSPESWTILKRLAKGPF